MNKKFYIEKQKIKEIKNDIYIHYWTDKFYEKNVIL